MRQAELVRSIARKLLRIYGNSRSRSSRNRSRTWPPRESVGALVPCAPPRTRAAAAGVRFCPFQTSPSPRGQLGVRRAEGCSTRSRLMAAILRNLRDARFLPGSDFDGSAMAAGEEAQVRRARNEQLAKGRR
jgi:hypothetical protein